MATHVHHHIGHQARFMLTGHRSVRVTPVAVTATRPSRVPSSHDLSKQHYPSEMSIFESARMSRELGREMPQSSLQRQKSANPILSALMNMSNQRFLILLVGLALLVGGLLALRFPVFLPDFDQWGFRINCGSGFQSASTQAGAADSAGTRFVHQCHTAIAMRRAWAIPLAVAGSLLLGALVIRPSRQRFVNARPAFRSVSAGSDLNADVTSAHARAA